MSGKLLAGAALLAALLTALETVDELDTAAGFELDELEDTAGAELAALDTGVTEAATEEDDLLETLLADDATEETADDATEAVDEAAGVAASTVNQLRLNPAVSALTLK